MARVERNRIVKLLGAGVYAQLITLLYQLGFIPITIGVWGAALAADWVVVTSLVAYLSLSDLGFSLAAGNRMCHEAAESRWSEVSRIYQSSLFLTLAATGVLIGLFGLVLLVFPVRSALGLTTLSSEDFYAIVGCQAALVLLGQLVNNESNLYRACGRAAQYAMLQNTSRLAEFVVVFASIWLGANPVGASIAAVGVRAGSLGILYFISSRNFMEITRTGWAFDFGLVRQLWLPSIGFMAFPVAFAFSNQFLLTAISAAGGPMLAFAFTTCRTLTRTIFQMGSLLASATAVNFTFAFGQKDFSEMRRLMRAALNLCFWGALAGGLFLMLAGPWIYALWTHKAIVFSNQLFLILIVDAILAALWFSCMALVGSANQHSGSAWMFAALSAAAVALSFWLVPWAGLEGVASSLLIVDLTLFVWVFSKANRVCGDRALSALQAMLNPLNIPRNAGFLIRR